MADEKIWPLRLLRLIPALTSTATLQFALDEHLIFGTWLHPSLHATTNTNLPAWWTRGGRRWQWVLILAYPVTYISGGINILVGRNPAIKWYVAGLGFSLAHMLLYVRIALRLIQDIEMGVPRGNVQLSMAGWIRMNWIRGLTTDLPAWVCFVVAATIAM